MRKLPCIIVSFILGVVVALSGSDAYAQVKSLIGKKVAGEMTVVVNGKTLTDKGAVIDGVTNVPARSLSNALGADVKVEGKIVTITTEQTTDKVVLMDGKYYTKYDLLNKKTDIENAIDKLPDQEEKYKKRYNELIDAGMIETAEKFKAADEKEINARKASYDEQLQKINEALQQFE